LPLKSQSFDRVLCHNVLECLNPERYVPIINEVCDLLQDGGIFLLSHMDFASARHLPKQVQHQGCDGCFFEVYGF